MEPGLSSPAAFRHWRGAAVRPTDGIGMGIVGSCVKVRYRKTLRKMSAKWLGARFNERTQCQQRGRISDPVDVGLSKMALKCHND
jgi:hypothetical protein